MSEQGKAEMALNFKMMWRSTDDDIRSTRASTIRSERWDIMGFSSMHCGAFERMASKCDL